MSASEAGGGEACRIALAGEFRSEPRVRTVPLTPFPDQKPGTSGLRKRVSVFQQPGYVEAFVQAVFDAMPQRAGQVLVVGGDGRFFNGPAIRTAIRIAAGAGFGRVVVGRGGLLSTPAASHLIRSRGAAGGLIFSASHNPGGPDGDFGIKFNVANGGPASEAVTDAIFARTGEVARCLMAEGEPDLDALGEQRLEETTVEVVDPVADYAELMERLIDFPAIRRAVAAGLRMRFDAMHAVTGPYAHEILERRLGFGQGTVVNGTPLPDFGGGHPDPNLAHAHALVAEMMAPGAPDLGAASDGDGDRNLVIGRGLAVTPSDSLAVLAANAHLAPAYAGGLKGVARSMPTSGAVDRVAAALGVPAFETPTGWKFFGSLLDGGLVTLCGEESAGAGSDHVREKDGLWAVLLWLNIVAVRGEPVDAILRAHWARFGRNYYARHDYEEVDAAGANALMDGLRERLYGLAGRSFGPLVVEAADEFAYHDPVDGSVSRRQGVRVLFRSGSRLALRLSGTGTAGATLRLYLERFEPPGGDLGREPGEALRALAEAAEEIAGVARHTGRAAPDLVT